MLHKQFSIAVKQIDEASNDLLNRLDATSDNDTPKETLQTILKALNASNEAYKEVVAFIEESVKEMDQNLIDPSTEGFKKINVNPATWKNIKVYKTFIENFAKRIESLSKRLKDVSETWQTKA